jgi:DNA-binding LytR/AlgR family response regulator
MKLVKFKTLFDATVFVNVDKVLYVDGNDNDAYIHLSDEMITVRGQSLEEVVAKLMG